MEAVAEEEEEDEDEADGTVPLRIVCAKKDLVWGGERWLVMGQRWLSARGSSVVFVCSRVLLRA